MQAYKAQELIIQNGSENNAFYIILDGTVHAQAGGEIFLLKKGDIVGIFDIAADLRRCFHDVFQHGKGIAIHSTSVLSASIFQLF